MDFNSLMASFVFGMIGMGMFMYGKKAGRPLPLAAGAGLMVVPYFISHLVIMIIVCGALTAVPWLFRDA
jgi:hypothetical protein